MEVVNSWLRCASPHDGAVVRLLCLPRTGGSAQDFFGWPEKMSGDVHVCAVQLPGRQERFIEDPIDRMDVLAAEVAALTKELSDLPLVLFGDCMGALAGFEVMRTLRRRGEPQPPCLIVASYPPPDYQRTPPFYHDAPWQSLRTHLELIGGVTEEALQEEELFKLLLPMLRADFAVYETYKYAPEP
ncbi:MAG TPA: thioesterase domain-containing protein, partial [Pyrinomonadaceae bacterium]